MNIKFLKLLDKYPGFFVCVVISLINKLFFFHKDELKNEEVKKILAMKFWGLGSILLLSPTIVELRKNFPDSQLVFLTLKRNKEISDELKLFDQVVTIDVDKGWWFFSKTLIKFFQYSWKEKFDLVIDFEFFTRFSSIITFLTFAKVKVGYHSWESWRGNIHNIKVPFNRYWHIMDNFYNLGRYIGLKKIQNLTIVKPFISEEDKKNVQKLLIDSGVRNNYISVHFNASDLAVERRWPYANFISLVTKFLQKYDLHVVFIGSKAEALFVKEIINNIKENRVVDFVGKLSISQLAYLFEHSQLVISNDSGPLHLAVAMDVPTISFFGPETPVIYGPKGEKHTVFFKNIDCSPCINVHDRKSVHCYWEKQKCMEVITVDEVFTAIESKLNHEKNYSA